MATVQGPLMSMQASGKLANSIVFGNWKGRPTVRGHVVPSNPQSAAQTGVRALMSFIGKNWANLSAGEKASWAALAAIGSYSNFNAFGSHNANRFGQFTMPRVDPAAAAGTAPVNGTQTLIAGVGEFTVSQAITTANNIWGIVVCASMSTGFTPGRTNVVAFKYGLAGPIEVVVKNRAAGTWYVRTASFNRGGTVTSFVAEGSVVVT